MRQLRRRAPLVLLLSITLVHSMTSTRAADPQPSYQDDVRLLAQHTNVLEFDDGNGAHVAVCPQWQGRVMTSTCDGPLGASFGWINRDFIAAGKSSKEFNNYGGEDRFWISPEAGQFGFFFAPGAEQIVTNAITPPGLNEGAFEVAQEFGSPAELGSRTFRRDGVQLTKRINLTNYSKTNFQLDIVRNFRLLGATQFAELCGIDRAMLIGSGAPHLVGFATENAVINRGPAMKRETGLLSIWSLGQFKPGRHTVIIAPFQSGDGASAVTSDYFGPVPDARLKIVDGAVYFLGDGKFRAKFGIAARRAKPIAGSFDFDNNVLTIVSYTLPADAARRMYINNLWQLPLDKPYQGDAFNSYNDGPAAPGAETLGGFYELETLSPTLELATGETLTHTHRTFHLQGDFQPLAAIARSALGVDLNQVRNTMFPK